MHPGTTYRAIRKYSVPKTGLVEITSDGNIRKGDISGGDGVNARITLNGITLWPATGDWQAISYNDATGYSINIEAFVKKGDMIEFEVDKKASNAYDSTIWNPIVTFTE